MTKRSTAGLVFLVLGILCLISALALWQNNRSEAQEAEASARAVMEQLAAVMEQRQAEAESPLQPISEPVPPPMSEHTVFPMDTIEIDGQLYIGFLTISDLNLELPVMESWDYDKLKTAPCRYTGTLAGNDLVIAAHNYLRHFGHLMDLSLGAEILFTDVSGATTRYTVAELEILQPTAVEEMTSGDYDLTLFTCTYGGATRFTVRCLRK